MIQPLLGTRWTYALMGVLGAIVAASQLRQAARQAPAHLWLVVGLWALVILLWAVRTRLPTLAWTVGMSAATAALYFLAPNGAAAPVALFILLISLGARADLRLGLALAAATVAALLAIRLLRQPSFDLVSAALNLLGYSAAYLAAYAMRRLRDEREHLKAALEELRLSRRAQVESAKVEERARLAREIHDVLAHTLSALSVQLEGARLLAQQRPGDPAVGQALDRAHRLTREGLDEARRAVGALRGDTMTGPQALPTLAATFERDTGVPCRLEVDGEPRGLSQEAGLAFYRTAQEALSNVRKHSAATVVRMRLRWAEDGTELSVEDEGQARSIGSGSGYGLTGMRERAELLGGRLEAGAVPGGFRVRLWVPALQPTQELAGSPG